MCDYLSKINKYTLLVILLFVSLNVVARDDPFRPPWFKESKSLSASKSIKKQWYVNQILLSGDRRVAIINNAAVVVGDQISGAKVVNIFPSSVVLSYQGKEFTSPLMLVNMKKPIGSNLDY